MYDFAGCSSQISLESCDWKAYIPISSYIVSDSLLGINMLPAFRFIANLLFPLHFFCKYMYSKLYRYTKI